MSIVRVGLGVIIFRDGKVLLHKRKGAHGSGHWSFPGGHLEWMETWEECAAREIKEECGLDIENIRFSTATNDKMPDEDKHYITIYMVADAPEGEPQIMESDKCECWQWHNWDDLPEPLFVPVQNLIASEHRPKSPQPPLTRGNGTLSCLKESWGGLRLTHPKNRAILSPSHIQRQ